MSLVQPYSLFTDFDISLFKNGSHYNLFDKFGAHTVTIDGVKGTYFSVWAPTAKSVSVIGNFNFWQGNQHELLVRWDSSGIWEGFIPNVTHGELYKYRIESHNNGIITEKADPYGRLCEIPPKTASVVQDTSTYQWNDTAWMSYRKNKNSLDKPFSVYEVHIESWKKKEGYKNLSFRELATELVNYVAEMNFTHVEFMPIMEYPYSPSWGYQLTGYYAPSARFGTPDDLKYLIDEFHKNDIGVIVDWVPSHFPEDAHGLGYFDGSNLYEHPDPRKGYHQDWKSLIFNYGRNEVKAFLISNAVFWMQEFHVDALRVDAVASMLYLDYSRKDGEWEPNIYGGRENLEAIQFIKDFNTELYTRFEGIQTIAEESTAFTGVTTPTQLGGLGFGMKWMMGWMHDTLDYFSKDTIYRKHHHNEITFSLAYAFSENFMLPLSHDEVVYGKKSLIYRMPGDEWQRFANLRTLYGYMFTHPGTKLLFQGAEFGQTEEWNFQQSLDWHLLEFDPHKKMKAFVSDINKLYKTEPALYEKAFSPEGFEWIELNDAESSVLSYIRKGHNTENDLVIVCNLTPTIRKKYKIGVNSSKNLKEIFNSDLKKYHGSGIKNDNIIKVSKKGWHFKKYAALITLPPLSVVVFKHE
ncbi:1,4-alpha-glucan branching protein GlgB [Aquimarina agarilytica]|uniref:1,4-alpha-glucan branching protein GlgB n=1 Tax=Aquimarina agarilytica TaxID=1087449 RepID=UPI00028A049F|nr:1,4-alpha-glucan branching protein GlgB [Aquimarina agarilytica]